MAGCGEKQLTRIYQVREREEVEREGEKKEEIKEEGTEEEERIVTDARRSSPAKHPNLAQSGTSVPLPAWRLTEVGSIQTGHIPVAYANKLIIHPSDIDMMPKLPP